MGQGIVGLGGEIVVDLLVKVVQISKSSGGTVLTERIVDGIYFEHQFSLDTDGDETISIRRILK